MNRNENEAESFAGNFMAFGEEALFFEVPGCKALRMLWPAGGNRKTTNTIDAAVVAAIIGMRPRQHQRESLRARRSRPGRDRWIAVALPGVMGIASAAMPGIARAQDAVIATTTLPRDLSPWGMYLNADPVVKAVLIGLALASVITWTVCLAKAIEIFLAKRDVDAALNTLADVRSPAEGVERLVEGEVRQLLEAAVTEQKRSAGSEPEGVKGRIALRLERIEAAYGRRILRGTSVLATIGATAPCVGWFGTVGCIVN